MSEASPRSGASSHARPNWVNDAGRAAELTGYRLGSNVLRFDERDIHAWLAERRGACGLVPAGPAPPTGGG